MVAGERLEPVAVAFWTRIVFPRHGDKSGRKLFEDFRILDNDVAPSHRGLPVLSEAARDVAELFDKKLCRLPRPARLFRRKLNLKCLVEADVDEAAREKLRELINPVVEERRDLWIARVELGPVREVGQTRVALDAEEVVQMAVKLEAGHDIDVPRAPVGDDAADLFFRKAAAGVQDRIARKLDARFAVKVILVGLPTRQEIQLAFDFLLSRERPVAHVHHRAAISERRPVVDRDFRHPGVFALALD